MLIDYLFNYPLFFIYLLIQFIYVLKNIYSIKDPK